MDQSFSFKKKDKLPVINRENGLEQICIPYSVEECMGIEEVAPRGYEDKRWIERSNAIKYRDNYTCQLCHTFNPMLGHVFIQQGVYDTLHMYDYNKYQIHVIGYNLTINFEFNEGFHLAMPRLNVHHKIYYRNHNLWDYQDDCLVTLCEDCHHYVHSLKDIGIPIMEENELGKLKLCGVTQPKAYNPNLDHTDLGTFHPFALVKENRWGDGLTGSDLNDYKRAKDENKKWFEYHKFLDNDIVKISYLYIGDSRFNTHSKEESEVISDYIIKDFIENILGFRKVEQ